VTALLLAFDDEFILDIINLQKGEGFRFTVLNRLALRNIGNLASAGPAFRILDNYQR
jgi:hypothetical protein